MNFRKVVLKNFRRDFKELLSRSPGYLICKIVVGFGKCKTGIISGKIKENGMMLTGPDGFEFERISKVVSSFSNPESKEPLLICINLAIPSGTTFIYQLYEIEKGADDIILKNQSTHREL